MTEILVSATMEEKINGRCPYLIDPNESCGYGRGMGLRLPIGRGIAALVLLAGCRGDISPVRAWHQALYGGECPLFDCYGNVERALPLLRRTRTSIYLAVPTAKFGDPALKKLLQNAWASGVEVRAWILLFPVGGYWPNGSNADAFSRAVKDFVRWSDTEGLGVKWIVVDLEPSLENIMLPFYEELIGGNITAATALLRNNLDPADHAVKKGKYADLLSFLHSNGWKALAVTEAMVLDDMKDGDQKLQDALDIPVSGLDWDNVSFMVYLTNYLDYVPQKVGADLVYSYSLDAREYFGDRGGIALGVVKPGKGAGDQDIVYTDPPVLHRDIGASLAGDVSEVQIFSLEGILGMGDADEWLGKTSVSESPPKKEPATQFVRDLFFSIDSSL